MMLNLVICPPVGTRCPNGVVIVGAEARRGDMAGTILNIVSMRKRLKHHLVHFDTLKVCKSYGELDYEISMVVTVSQIRSGERTYSFEVKCSDNGKLRHPHINGSSVCQGNNPPLWRRMLEHGTPVYRIFEAVEDMLKYYSPANPYFHLKKEQMLDGTEGGEEGGEEPEFDSSCDRCGSPCNNDDLHSVNGGDECICESCYEEYAYTCEHCNRSMTTDSSTVRVTASGDTETWCERCTDRDSTFDEDEGCWIEDELHRKMHEDDEEEEVVLL